MKNTIIYLLAICFMMQSCYSYRNIDLKNPEFAKGKLYKIKTGSKFQKVRIMETTSDKITVLVNDERKEVSLSDITEAKKRKFSVVKTVLLGSFAAAFIAIIVALSTWNLGEMGEIGAPD